MLPDDERDAVADELPLTVPVVVDEYDDDAVEHSVPLPDLVRDVDFVLVTLTVAEMVAEVDLVRDGELVPHDVIDTVGVAESDEVIVVVDVKDEVADSEPELVAVDDTVEDADNVEHELGEVETVDEKDAVVDGVPEVVVEADTQADTDAVVDDDREYEGLEDDDCVDVCDSVAVGQLDTDNDGVAEFERLEQLDEDGEIEGERERLLVAHAEFDAVPVFDTESEREPVEVDDGVKEPVEDFCRDTEGSALGDAVLVVESVGENVAEELVERDRDTDPD